MVKMRWFALSFLAMLLPATLFLVAACASPYRAIEVELKENEQRWATQGIADYQYRLQIQCFCPQEVTQPVVIHVRNMTTISVVNAMTGEPVPGEYFTRADNIDKLFDVVQDAISRKADQILVSYDSSLGYPARIHIDFVKQAVDDEIVYDISSLTPMR